jgi:hypothetical protein
MPRLTAQAKRQRIAELDDYIARTVERWASLGLGIEEAQTELQSLKADKPGLCGCVEIRHECPFGKKHCPDCECDGCLAEREGLK